MKKIKRKTLNEGKKHSNRKTITKNKSFAWKWKMNLLHLASTSITLIHAYKSSHVHFDVITNVGCIFFYRYFYLFRDDSTFLLKILFIFPMLFHPQPPLPYENCFLSVFLSNGWKIQWNDRKRRICRFYLMCLSSQFFYSLNFL